MVGRVKMRTQRVRMSGLPWGTRKGSSGVEDAMLVEPTHQ
jgi:hypothetical protein